MIKYDCMKYKQNFFLKLRAFLSLQKNSMHQCYIRQAAHKKVEKALKKSFNSLKMEYKLSILKKKFYNIQRKLSLIWNFKVLSYRSKYTRYKRLLSNKAQKHYNSYLIKKVFRSLKFNTIKTTEEDETAKRVFNKSLYKNYSDEVLLISYNKTRT